MRRRQDDGLWAVGAGGAGAVWGLGLARFFALEVRLSFFLGVGGTALVALLTAGACLILWWLRVRRGDPARLAALRLAPLCLPLADLFLRPSQPWRGPVLLLGGLLATLLGHLRRPLPVWANFLLAAGLPIAVYLPDVAPWVGRADTFEFQVVAPSLAVAHPSGYPLYVLVGKLFSLLPIGTVAWRVNMSSAVCAASAAWFLYQAVEVGTRFGASADASAGWPDPGPGGGFGDSPRAIGGLSGSSASSLLAALTLAFSPTLWSRAVEAEVYALNALLVALTLWVVVRWAQGGFATERALPLLGLLIGVGIASHLTLGALLFLVAPVALMARPHPSGRSLVTALGLFVAGLALYLYIPLRWPAVNDGEVMSLSHFLAFVTNAESGGALHPLAFIRDPGRCTLVFRLVRMQVGWGGLALAGVGLVSTLRRRASLSLGLGTVLASAAWVWFNLGFYVAEPDYSAFLVPAHVILIFWVGIGLARLADLVQRRSGVFLPLFLTVGALLPLSRMWLTGPTLDTAQERADDARGRYVLSLPIAPDAAILADSEKFPPLYYLQRSEGLRTDLDVVMRFDEAGYRQELEARLQAGQTVYLARYLPHLEGYHLRSLGPLVEVGTASLVEPPADGVPMEAVFGSEIELLAFDRHDDPVGRATTHLTLYWRANAPSEKDQHVQFRLVDGQGSAVWLSDPERPVGGFYPTNAWPVGAVVPDYHAVAAPSWLPRGEYGLEVGLFSPFGDVGLEVDGTATPWLALGSLTADPSSGLLPPLPHELRYNFGGGGWLTGCDIAGEVPAGAPFVVDLAWQGIEDDGEVRLSWVRGGEEDRGVSFSLPAGASRTRHIIVAPQSADEHLLSVGMVGESVRCNWLASPVRACPLGAIKVVPAREELANFGDLVLLLEAQVGRESARSGEIIPVTLRWRSLRAMDKDYTVFVQLVGPDGRLHGQIDMWPVQGSRPTSGWAPGEELGDPYEVRLDGDAPPGDYQVVVGWYLLATMQRLSTLDANGRPSGDFVVAGEFHVID
jgi:hypothetical protein